MLYRKFTSRIEEFLYAVVLSNEREVCVRNGITYLPIYYCMFYQSDKTAGGTDLVIP